MNPMKERAHANDHSDYSKLERIPRMTVENPRRLLLNRKEEQR